RARIEDFHRDGEILVATAGPIEDLIVEKTIEVEALMRTVVGQIERYAKLSENVPEGAAEAARQIETPGQLADAVAYSPEMTFAQRQELLEIEDPLARLRWATDFLEKQLEILEIGQKIRGEVRKAAEQNQRDFFLREQLKAIQKELGERGGQAEISDDLRKKVEEAGMPDEIKERALREVERLEALP